ncbi:hypothetical protein BRC67_09680 [Halobacteriales archaeon QH_3_68_24]|nr:MAG: hypothetical protein BRC67_09680 [Halobacteriales archaeon QH_3_68_24]
MGESEFDTSGMRVEVDRVKTESSVDDQVDGLKQLKGGDDKTARSETTVDDQTEQLRELTKRREQEQAADEDGEKLASFTDRVAGLLGRD